jgi:hypothetical protein
MQGYKYFVFANPEDKGKHYNSIPTVLHDTAIDAEKEAERLATQEAGVRFCVGVIYKHFINIPKPKVVEVNYGLTNLAKR